MNLLPINVYQNGSTSISNLPVKLKYKKNTSIQGFFYFIPSKYFPFTFSSLCGNNYSVDCDWLNDVAIINSAINSTCNNLI